MAKKPSLSDLTTQKPAQAANDENLRKPQIGSKELKRTKQVAFRVHLAGWRELSDLAKDLTISTGEKHTAQSMFVDAVNEILKKNGRPPVA